MKNLWLTSKSFTVTDTGLDISVKKHFKIDETGKENIHMRQHDMIMDERKNSFKTVIKTFF